MARFSGAMAEVVRDFNPGYRLAPGANGSGKYNILDPNGEVVRAENGMPVTLSSTPSANGTHYVKRVRSSLVKTGVVPANDDDRRAELVERVKETPEAIKSVDSTAPAIRTEETFFGVRYHENLPAIVLNVSWDEFNQLQQVAGFIADRGPRTQAQLEGFLKLTERAKKLMERQVELHLLRKVRDGTDEVRSGTAVGA